MVKSVEKIIRLVLGLFFIGLGFIGLLLPVIPQVPFFVIGIVLLCSASTHIKTRFKKSKLYQKHLKKHIDKNNKLKAYMEG